MKSMKKHTFTKGAKRKSVDEAVRYGIDLSLLDINLGKPPEQRIQDANDAWLAVLELRKAVRLDGK